MLQPGEYYHIYNRGNNAETLFREQRNYPHFPKLYAKYIEPVAETHAYCLLKNHSHFLVWINVVETGPVSETGPVLNPSQFNNLFIAYAKAFNKAYDRTGSLFESPFRRKRVDSDRFFTRLIAYTRTRRNPVKHGFVDDLRDWPYSSYRAVLSTKPTRVQRATVLDWFGGPPGFEAAHALEVEEGVIEALIVEDWV